MSGASIAAEPWLRRRGLQALLAALSADGEEARVAGGAVRNALLGEPVNDVDVATTTVPDETTRRAREAGFRVIPTGIAHGTVTVLADDLPVEVTTLRADVETDGRHATVAFGRDWQADASRRDFTVNALYATASGAVVDLVGGLDDLRARTIRFIGDPEERIREDYLRILRFFRFFARYGGGRPDAAGLMACARLKDGLDRLSAERVWAELRKTLGAPDPRRALLWMRQAGVLDKVLPESAKWGIDAIHDLVAAEQALGWEVSPILRLAAIVPPDAERLAALAARLKLSNAEAERLNDWARAPQPKSDMTEGALSRLLYADPSGGLIDRLRLALASARGKSQQDTVTLSQAAGFARLLRFAESWRRPALPIGGADLKQLGYTPGPALGTELARVEGLWVASGFSLERDQLLAAVIPPPA